MGQQDSAVPEGSDRGVAEAPFSHVFPVLLEIDVLLALGVLLLIDAVVCFVGIWLAFPIGALLSFLMLPLVALEWNALGTMYSSISIGVAVAAMISDGFAAVSRTKLPEQNHPLNLPVFG